MMDIKEIGKLMFTVQQSSCPRKYVNRLRNVYDKLGFDIFFKEYMRCMKHFLWDKSLAKQNPYVDTGLEFCVLFSTSFQSTEDDSTAPFLVAVFREVLRLSNVAQTRYRVCYFINLLLQHLGEGQGDLDEDICFSMRDAMLERIRDVKPAVQIQAIEILQKLQDPTDPNDLVVEALLYACCDPSAQVRRAAIRCVGITRYTIPALLRRCRDVHYLARYSAYERLSKLHIRMLKIEQRQYLISCGLNDLHKKVVNHVRTVLISNWLSNCDGNYFDLINALRLDADEKDWTRTEEMVGLSLKAVFKEGVLKDLMEILPLGPDRVITFVGKNWEQIVYWRSLVTYLKSDKTLEEYVDRIMPDLTIFCAYIRSVYQSRNGCKQPHEILEHHQIMYELLVMLKQFDLSDEVGRSSVHKLIVDLLIETNHLMKNLIVMIDILEDLIPNLDIRFEEINDLISKIRNPIIVGSPPKDWTRQRDVKMAEIRVKLNIATDDQKQAIARTNFREAERLKHVINDLHVEMKRVQDEFSEKQLTPIRATKNDVPTWCQCVDILIAAMRSAKVKKMPAVVFKLHEEFVQPLTVSCEPDICSRVLKFCPLLGIIDKSIAISTLHLFTDRLMMYKAVPSTDVETTLLALYAMTDLLLMYGSSILSKETEKARSHKRQLFNETSIDETGDFTLTSPPTLVDIIDIISSMLDDTIMEVREKACTAVVKLMYNKVIQSVMILSKLVLKWFNPATAKDARILQLLGKFFTEYFTNIPESVNLTHKLFVPTLTSIVDAPKHSPLAEIEVLRIIKFLIEICRPNRHSVAIGLDAYKMISLTLCREIMERPNNKVTLVYMKTLVLITPPFDDVTVMQDLRSQAELMVNLIKDKGVIKYVERYRSKLDGNMNEGVTDKNTDADSRTSNETYLSLPESTTTDDNSERLSDDDECNTIQDITHEPEDDATLTVIHNVPEAVVGTPTLIELTTKAMKRRKKRGRAKQKQTEDMVGESAIALSNVNLSENNEDEEQEGQVMVVQTDSDSEQPRAKAHVPEIRATPSRKAKTKVYQPTTVVTRAKKSITGSYRVLKSADSEQEQPTTAKQIETRANKGGRKSNADYNKSDSEENQSTKPKGTRTPSKKGGGKSNTESEAKLPSTDSESDQPAAELKKTEKQGKRGERKSNVKFKKVLESMDIEPEPEDTQTVTPVQRRSRHTRTSRKLDE